MQAIKIANTKDMPREEWLRQRKSIIGGSDASAIVGMNPFKSAFEVWLDKTDPDHIEEKNSEAMRQGTDFEDYVAERFMEREGKKVRRDNFIRRHSQYPFIGANVDRMVIGENAGLECKTTSVYNKSDFRNGEYPEYYYVQCMHYMAVTGADRWYLAVLVLSKDFFVFEVERDEDDINSLINAERDFWSRYVIGGEVPPPDGSKNAGGAMSKLYPKAEIARAPLYGAEESVRDYLALSDEIRALEKRREQIKQELQLQLGDAEIGDAQGYEVRWTNRAGSRKLDKAALMDDYPDIDLDDYYTTGAPTRTFTVKEIKEDI